MIQMVTRCLTTVNIWYGLISSWFVIKHSYRATIHNILFSYGFFYKDTSGVARLQQQSTATYCAVITESGELSLGLGDMDIHQQITEQYVSSAFMCNFNQNMIKI